MKKGFTLIELLAVIMILGIVTVIAVPSVNKLIKNSRKGAWETSGNSIVKGVEIYYQQCRASRECKQKGLTIIDSGSIMLDGISTIADFRKVFALKGKLPELEEITTLIVDEKGDVLVFFKIAEEYYCTNKENKPGKQIVCSFEVPQP